MLSGDPTIRTSQSPISRTRDASYHSLQHHERRHHTGQFEGVSNRTHFRCYLATRRSGRANPLSRVQGTRAIPHYSIMSGDITRASSKAYQIGRISDVIWRPDDPDEPIPYLAYKGRELSLTTAS